MIKRQIGKKKIIPGKLEKKEIFYMIFASPIWNRKENKKKKGWLFARLITEVKKRRLKSWSVCSGQSVFPPYTNKLI